MFEAVFESSVISLLSLPGNENTIPGVRPACMYASQHEHPKKWHCANFAANAKHPEHLSEAVAGMPPCVFTIQSLYGFWLCKQLLHLISSDLC